MSVLPTQWIQTLLGYNNCPPKPNTVQETTGDQAFTYHWTGMNSNTSSAYVHMSQLKRWWPCCFTGSGILEWRPWGKVKKSRGRPLWHAASPQCWLWLRVSFCPTVEEGQATSHPTFGPGTILTWRSLACELQSWSSCLFDQIFPFFCPIFNVFSSCQAMEGSMLTISLGIWMELPGVNYRDLTNDKQR